MKILTPLILKKFGLMAALAAISAMASQAQTLVITNLTDPDTSVLQSATPRTYENNGDLGFVFQVGSSALTLNDLGVYAPNAGLQGSTAVDVYKITGNTTTLNTAVDPLVASVNVAAGTDPGAQGYAYASITPTVLLAGQQYAIYFVDSSVDEFFDAKFNGSGTSTQKSSLFDTADITPMSNVLNASNSSNDYYVSPNAKFTGGVTPEPSSLALLIAGLGTLVLVARFRIRTA